MERTADSGTSLRIAIQKDGRLTDKTIQLLEGIGLRFDNYKRSLMLQCRNFDVELLLIRDDDIPEYVQDGVCDLGFVGGNVTAETEADVTYCTGLILGCAGCRWPCPRTAPFKRYRIFRIKLLPPATRT